MELDMKAKLVTIAAALTFVFGLSGNMQAQDLSGPPAQVCNATDNLATVLPGITLTHDACVLIVNDIQKFNVFPASECKFIEDNGGLQESGFENFGQCVDYWETFFNPGNKAHISATGFDLPLQQGVYGVPWKSGPPMLFLH
jgi:hypothetical protein